VTARAVTPRVFGARLMIMRALALKIPLSNVATFVERTSVLRGAKSSLNAQLGSAKRSYC
jgi:hypothetical protein